MKNFLLAASAILLVSSVSAQSLPNAQERAEYVKKMRERIAEISKETTVAHKTTAIKQRLIGSSGYSYNGVNYYITDSNRYTYSNSRGSDFTMDYPWLFPGQYYQWGGYADYDTGVFYYSDPSFGLRHRYLNSYNSSGKLSTSVFQKLNGSTFEDHSKYECTYNSNNKVSVTSSYNYFNSQWVLYVVHKKTYDAQQRLIADTMLGDSGSGLQYVELIIYSYTGGNLMQEITMYWDGMVWGSDHELRYAYYSNNKMKSCTLRLNPSASWVDLLKDSIGYATSGAINYEVTFENAGSGLEFSKLMTRHINSANLPDSVFYFSFNGSGWDPGGTDVLIYNSYDNLETQLSFDISPIADGIRHFYYEEYNDLGLNDINKTVKLSVCPNPATSNISIQTPENFNAPYSITILNNLGQKIRTIESNKRQVQIELPVESLTPGLYFLTLESKSGKATGTFIKN